MEQGKKKARSLKELLTGEEIKNTLFASLLGDGNGNYNMFRIVRGGNTPLLTQRIYPNDFRNNLQY